MIEAVATVTHSERGQVQLTWQSQSACGHCQQNDECGTGVIAKAFAAKHNQLSLPSAKVYPIGTQLRLGITETSLLKASALVYLCPLLGLIFAALIGQLFFQHEATTILLAMIGGGLGFRWARSRALKQPQAIQILGELGVPVGNT